MKKFICFFAGFDTADKIHDYVIYYLTALSEYADIYYLADCNMPPKELQKISHVTKAAYSYRHKKYDFGSWQELTQKIGWNTIEQYQGLILANDSCYGPLFPFSELFQTMEKQPVDFWGLTQHKQMLPHLQSYFMVLKQKIVQDNDFRRFISHITVEDSFTKVVTKYEIGLSNLLVNKGYSFQSYIKKNNMHESHNPCTRPLDLLRKSCPLIKVKCFLPQYNHLDEWYPSVKKAIIKNTSYDFNLIIQHIKSKGTNLYITEWKLCLKSMRWLYQKKPTKNNYLLVKILKIPVYYKKLELDPIYRNKSL